MSSCAASFAGSVAIVTGAGRGIGLTIAEAFLKAGARVAGMGRGKPPWAKADFPDRWLWLSADLRGEREVRRAAGAVAERFGRSDILVNNAGIGGPTAPVAGLRQRLWVEGLDEKV